MKRGDPITVAEHDAIGFRAFRQVWVLDIEKAFGGDNSYDRVTAVYERPHDRSPAGYNFALYRLAEGITWCRGHEGSEVAALRAAAAL